MRRAILLTVVAALLAETGLAASGPTTLGSDALTTVARDWLVKQLAPDVESSSIEPLGAPRELILPSGEVAINVTQQSGSAAVGIVTVLVEAVVTDPRGGRTTRSATVTFKINALQDVVVAVRDLPRKTVISAADVRRERRPLSRVPAAALRDVHDAVGKETTRPVAPGEALTAPSVAAPLVIRRGAIVALLLEGPNFKIVARGIAAEDAVAGAPIRVINQTSRREVVGRVQDDRTVRVAY